MMNKSLILILCFIFILTSCGVSKGEPIKISLGVKSWLVEWHSVNPDGDFKSRVGIMAGPSAVLKYESFFLGATYIMGDFDFPMTLTSDEIKTTRVDTDVSAGFYLTNNFGMILGYKWIDFTFDFPNQTNIVDLTEKTGGTFGGLLGNKSLGHTGFNLYGNLTYSWLQRHVAGGAQGVFRGLAGEVGLTYTIPASSFTFSEGIKYQNYTDPTVNSLDRFVGVIFSGIYSF